MYIMEHRNEPARIRAKTSNVLTHHHLTWIGLQPGERFVDFGCATGEVTREAARMGASAVGLDGDPTMAARATAAGHDLNTTYAVHRIGSGRPSPLEPASFDHAWTRFLLEYLSDPQTAVDEMAALVRPGGAVNLIDIEGNLVWHHNMGAELCQGVDEVMAALQSTGFDPHCGRRLTGYLRAAGLVEVRTSVEPYHYIVGTPPEDVAAHWRAKLDIMRENFTKRLFPEKAHLAWVFDAFHDFLMAEDTMTWSLLHLAQGRTVAV